MEFWGPGAGPGGSPHRFYGHAAIFFPQLKHHLGLDDHRRAGVDGFGQSSRKNQRTASLRHQHQDLAAFAVTAGVLVNLFLAVTFLPRHPQAQTMAWAFFGGSLTTKMLYTFFAFRAGCRPTYPGSPKIGWPDFKPLWFWGRRFFLYSLLDNLASNLPTLLAGRFLSLEMLGVWGVLQRIANMMSQAVQKIPQLAAPALMEMHSRGEETRFRRRSGQVLIIQNCLGGAALGALSFGGDFFLKVWLGKPIPMDCWVLPLFTFGLLADFDQRIRFSMDAIRLQMWRPTIAAVLKVSLILLLVPWMSRFYSLTGMTLALAIISGLVLLPISLVGIFPQTSYCLSPKETVAGLAAYVIMSGVAWFVFC